MDVQEARELHRKLVEDGWTRRFTVEEPRLSEMKHLYESLGLEVRAETAIPEGGQHCTDCLNLPEFPNKYKTIYTRPRSDGRSDKEDDFFE